jgi:hypothetical protein
MATFTIKKQHWIDRRGVTRTVPMRVLVLGYPRTGTACESAAAVMAKFELNPNRDF